MTHAEAVLAVVETDPGGRVLGHRFVDPTAAILSGAELAATRGDGIFETISIGSGRPQATTAHLERLVRSARMLDLPEPDLDGWRRVVQDVAARLAEHPESWVKTVWSRGIEGSGVPTAWAWAEPSPDHTDARTHGIRAVVLDRGWSTEVARTSPWLLAGAKTLSYGPNMAAKREAARRGADDVVYLSTEGVLLEGPTSNLIVRIDGTLATPDPEVGILPGTSQRDAFRFAEQRDVPTEYRRLTPRDLDGVDAAWLISSVRHAAPIRAIDGRPVPVDAEFTGELNRFLVGRTE